LHIPGALAKRHDIRTGGVFSGLKSVSDCQRADAAERHPVHAAAVEHLERALAGQGRIIFQHGEEFIALSGGFYLHGIGLRAISFGS